MAYLHIYNGTVTPGGVDGTEISYDGAQTNAITFTLDAAKSEEKTQAIALRCEEGYKTDGDTQISFTGTTAGKWSVCDTETGEYKSTLTISDSIGATNTVIYVKAEVSTEETPKTDISVSLNVEALIVTAEG